MLRKYLYKNWGVKKIFYRIVIFILGFEGLREILKGEEENFRERRNSMEKIL